jgi:hypothetical protein
MRFPGMPSASARAADSSAETTIAWRITERASQGSARRAFSSMIRASRS